MDNGLKAAIAAAGSKRKLAFLLGITTPALLAWKRVPAHRILQVEAVTGVPREQLRPDLYEGLASVWATREVSGEQT
jgi:DNA-binding transcriptional regulator YdaS (Cro superfamily)